MWPFDVLIYFAFLCGVFAVLAVLAFFIIRCAKSAEREWPIIAFPLSLLTGCSLLPAFSFDVVPWLTLFLCAILVLFNSWLLLDFSKHHKRFGVVVMLSSPWFFSITQLSSCLPSGFG